MEVCCLDLLSRRTLLFSCKKYSQLTASSCLYLQDLLSFCAGHTFLRQPSASDSTEQGYQGLLLSAPYRTPARAISFPGTLFWISQNSVRSALQFDAGSLLYPASSCFSFHRCESCTGLRILSLLNPVSSPLLSFTGIISPLHKTSTLTPCQHLLPGEFNLYRVPNTSPSYLFYASEWTH